MSSSTSSIFFRGNSDVLTDRGRLLPFGRSVTPVELIFFSSRSTLVQTQFFPENFLNRRCELQFFSWRKTLISARSSLLIFLILNKTIKKTCHLLSIVVRLMAPLCFPRLIQINYKLTLGMKWRWFCAKFRANLINTSEVRSRKTK